MPDNGWLLTGHGDPKHNDYHVVPVDDLREHELTRECWCKPELEDDNCVVHNSLDRREEFEEGRLPS